MFRTKKDNLKIHTLQSAVCQVCMVAVHSVSFTCNQFHYYLVQTLELNKRIYLHGSCTVYLSYTVTLLLSAAWKFVKNQHFDVLHCLHQGLFWENTRSHWNISQSLHYLSPIEAQSNLKTVSLIGLPSHLVQVVCCFTCRIILSLSASLCRNVCVVKP